MTSRTHSAKDVAEAFGVAPVTVRLWAAQGRIPCSRTLGGHRRFDLDEVRRAANLIPIGGRSSDRSTPDDRYSAAAAVERIDDRLHGAGYDERGQDFRDDAALRAVIDLRDTLRRVSSEKFSRLVAVPPICVADGPWDAFVAAIVEDEGAQKGIPVPRWTDDPRRFIKPFWFLSPVEKHRSWGLAHTHGALLRHGVVAAHEDLESV